MRKVMRGGLMAAALLLGLMLAACENFDPTAIFDAEIFNTKKKLPGERHPVFPEGTPGVSQGVPPELMKGYQPPAEPEPASKQPGAPAKQATAAEPGEPKSKPKPKPKPKVVAKPPDQQDPPTGTVRSAEPAPQQPQWPSPPQQQEAPPPPSGWQQRSGGIAWPDPPASR